MRNDILLPHVVMQVVGTRVIFLDTIRLAYRLAHLNRLVRKEEVLRVGREVDKVKVNLLKRLKSCRREFGGIKHQVEDVAILEPINHPSTDKLTNILDINTLDNIALDTDELCIGRVLVVQGIEAVELEEIVETRCINLSLRFAILGEVLHPKLSRHGYLEQVAEVLALAMYLKPVAQVLARLTAVILEGLQLVGKPSGMDVDEAQGQLTALATTSLIDVWNVIQHVDIFHYLLVLIYGELVGLGVKP